MTTDRHIELVRSRLGQAEIEHANALLTLDALRRAERDPARLDESVRGLNAEVARLEAMCESFSETLERLTSTTASD
ncbi:MAG: hypothetical protein ABR609_07855 [Acidimicrobiia bacterium]